VAQNQHGLSVSARWDNRYAYNEVVQTLQSTTFQTYFKSAEADGAIKDALNVTVLTLPEVATPARIW
jgi:hypothetical protein